MSGGPLFGPRSEGFFLGPHGDCLAPATLQENWEGLSPPSEPAQGHARAEQAWFSISVSEGDHGGKDESLHSLGLQDSGSHYLQFQSVVGFVVSLEEHP